MLEKDGITQTAFTTDIRLTLRRFHKNTFLAHNGKQFDDKIMKSIFPNESEFIDTLSLIPIHYDGKLETKKLSELHKQIMGEGFPAHRAMADVDALIRIMKKLKIRF